MRLEPIVLLLGVASIGCFVGGEDACPECEGEEDGDDATPACEGCSCAPTDPPCAEGLGCVDGTCVAPGMVWIPAGAFERGCEGAGCSADEGPVRELVVSGFAIDIHEVTVTEYTACVLAADAPCSLPERMWEGEDSPYNFGAPHRVRHPINGVTWAQADHYCKWLGKHLPTEAQWEKAARGPEGSRYPWGPQAPTCSRAQLYIGGPGCGTGHTAAVGTKLGGRSSIGLVDMAGNVAEWTADFYAADYYQHAPELDPRGPLQGMYRVIRGGSWRNTPARATTTARDRSSPNYPASDIGFRCAR